MLLYPLTQTLPNHPIPDPPAPTNYYSADHHLQIALQRYFTNDPEGWQWANDLLLAWGATCAQQVEPLYAVAEKNGPVLHQFDRRGDRVDEITFHPTYREIEKLAYGSGIAAMCNVDDYDGRGQPAPQLVKFAAMYLFTQAEGSVACPLSMTDILARVLNKYATPELRQRYVPHLTSCDPESLYTGAMFMTEKTGGSDVGATTTIARYVDGQWLLSGDKWFCSNANADLILTLARPEGAPAGTRGLGLFLVPRILPDGSRNYYGINRLKDKLGTRAMASGEVTLTQTTAYLIEPLERGFVMKMEMVNGTRLHSGVAGAAALRRAVTEAVSHARERQSFGQTLAAQPLIAEQLADLVVDSQAATTLTLAAAHRLDRADKPDASPQDHVLSRLLIALLKRYGAAHGVQGAQTALEIRGGNGYIEEWPNARILRDALVQVIWEGGINMVSFDVLRLIGREGAWPIFVAALQTELDGIPAPVADLRGSLTRLGREVDRIQGWVRPAQEIVAPQLAETMAMLYSAVLLTADAGYARQQNDSHASRLLSAARRYQTRFLEPALATLRRFDHGQSDAADLVAGAV